MKIQHFSGRLAIAAFFFSLFITACNNEPSHAPAPVQPTPSTPTISYAVKNTLPHDPSHFTEGLVMQDGLLYESTGSPENLPQTKSLVVATDLKTGQTTQKIELDKSKYFGEGIVFLKGKLYQLTYKNKTGFIYDAHTFKQIGTFAYDNAEGWGMTTDGTYLIMNDGTDVLTWIDPATMKPVKTVHVTENDAPLAQTNELEYINGYLYANVWQTDWIVKIDPATGKVVGKLDLSSLRMEAANKNPAIDVLNGIAYDSTNKKVYVTGKLWPNIYELEFAY